MDQNVGQEDKKDKKEDKKHLERSERAMLFWLCNIKKE